MYENLIRLEKKHIPRVGKMLTNAFHDSPMFKYLFSDDKKRKKLMEMIFPIAIQILNIRGNVYVTSENVEGAFCVTRHGKKNKKGLNFPLFSFIYYLPKILLNLFPYNFLVKARKLKGANNALDYFKRTYNDFLIIDAVSVDPLYRHQGHMSKLMRSALKEVDETKSFCVLQTETKENVAIYQHLGFKLINKIIDDGVPFPTYVLLYDPYKITKS
ncbi:GNAT family N-acetyltransferase [Priestia flexa]|uniref:GNAT family N-acetyltransferase n=1 Tax=Priestia flexa TaxID=86664 RepID=UPI001B32FEFA|nr:GNAT family N-acetyltransferase [Priestia flexa]